MKPWRNSAFGAPSGFSGIAGSYLIMDLSAYFRSEEFVMVTQYPAPKSSIYGHITTFSPGVYYHLNINYSHSVVLKNVFMISNRYGLACYFQ